MKKFLIIGGIVLLLGGVFLFIFLNQDVLGKATSDFKTNASDVVGTKTGTTTTGVYFGTASTTANVATTTYPVKIGGNINIAVFTLGITKASSTPDGGASNLRLSVLASNDDFCDTATTTSSLDYVTTREINWFDAAPFFRNVVGQTAALPVGTTTITWNTSNGTGTGREIVLDGLSVQCLALQVNGSSTAVWAQIRTK